VQGVIYFFGAASETNFLVKFQIRMEQRLASLDEEELKT
jgi:hypothetical protein